MQALGERLRNARELKGTTASEAAEATKLKVQHINALENEEFDQIAAPIYVKGFLKIYAEYLGLESNELIEQYKNSNAPLTPNEIVGNVEHSLKLKTQMKIFDLSKRDRQSERTDEDSELEKKSLRSVVSDLCLSALATLKKINISPRIIRRGLTLIGALLVLILIISSLGNCASRRRQSRSGKQNEDISLIEGIPEPYIEPEFIPKN